MRLLDLAASLIGLIILCPLLLVVALLIKLDSPGPVLYRAKRVGKDGRPFHLFKFRSMVSDADRRGPGITTAGDQRVTRVGGWLRRTKVDELPQLINVLRGEMSLVGPRPEDPRYVALYTPEQRRVLAVRPGITSPASLKYRHEEQLLSGSNWEQTYTDQIMPDKIEIELDYLSQRSLWSDLGSDSPDSIESPISRQRVILPTSQAMRMQTLRNRHFFLIDLFLLPLAAALAFALRLDAVQLPHIIN